MEFNNNKLSPFYNRTMLFPRNKLLNLPSYIFPETSYKIHHLISISQISHIYCIFPCKLNHQSTIVPHTNKKILLLIFSSYSNSSKMLHRSALDFLIFWGHSKVVQKTEPSLLYSRDNRRKSGSIQLNLHIFISTFYFLI